MTFLSRLLTIVLITFAFVGQTFSGVAEACDMHKSESNKHAEQRVNTMQKLEHHVMDHQQMQHSLHQANNMDAQTDCCGDVDCSCSSGVCSSTHFIHAYGSSLAKQLDTENVFEVVYLPLNRQITYPYRPPISA